MSGILLPAPVTDLAIGPAENPNEVGNRLTTLTGVGPNKPKRAALTSVPSVVASAITAFVIAYRAWLTRASFGVQPSFAALVSGFLL